MSTLEAYYETAFSSAVDGNIYQELSPLDRLAHNRRVALLNALPLPDLSNATVVDYGVGAWGIGAVFSRLKTAKRAIGIDISASAVEMSKKLSSADPELRSCIVEYRTGSGYSLPLESGSIDVFFSGECIEHIEDTDLHLVEVRRVLKPDGIAIFTTPNADPWMYRQFGLRWCVGFEHVALMATEELSEHLGRHFKVEMMLGFNQSMHPSLDKSLTEEVANAWVNSCEKDATNATSIIALARNQPKIKESAPLNVNVLDYQEASTSSAFLDLDLSSGFKGRMVDKGGTLRVPVPKGSLRCNLILWSHTWSGKALVRYGKHEQIINLYSHVGGCRRVTLTDIEGCESIRITSMSEKDARSEGNQVIFFRAVFAITSA